jgi:LysW-gamma-L-alpha-aminoadipyl-6-phosphate/LysW-L-glutamyl-5-phosphate reductase
MDKISVSVAGASGYTGMETMRYLLNHPVFIPVNLYGDQSAGKSFDEIHPGFTSILDLNIIPVEQLNNDSSDAVVLALPHGKSALAVKALLDGGYKGKIIDIGSDFRLTTPSDYPFWYGMEHPCPEYLPRFIYGLPEFNRKEIRDADFVANPGCFATAIQMGVMPLARAGLAGKVHITGVTGSSGSGAAATSTTHFSTRSGNLKAYKVFAHQHMAEVNQNLQKMCVKAPEINFTPVSGPFVRGIWMTLAGELNSMEDMQTTFESEYYNAPLVRLRSELPELRYVTGTAMTDIGWRQNDMNFVVGVAIDNMGKGAAGQMIQNLNLMFGLPEETGLLTPGQII